MAFITGPALGHVVRTYETALRLRDAASVTITFITPGDARFLRSLCADQFEIVGLPVEKNSGLESYELFAKALDSVFETSSFDLVVHDMCPLKWLSVARFPACPRAHLTNVFLTGPARADTDQVQRFSRLQSTINVARARRNLAPLASVFDLYDADLVLLADPSAVVGHYASNLPRHYRVCGSIESGSEAPLPDALAGLKDVLILSMGSTGTAEIDAEVVARTSRAAGCGTSVYVGGNAEKMRELRLVDHAYPWLSLGRLLDSARGIITHGGTGSAYQALTRGIAHFIYPSLRNQWLLAECLEALGVAVCIRGPKALDKLEQVDMAAMTERARVLGVLGSSEDGAQNAAKGIAALMSGELALPAT